MQGLILKFVQFKWVGMAEKCVICTEHCVELILYSVLYFILLKNVV